MMEKYENNANNFILKSIEEKILKEDLEFKNSAERLKNKIYIHGKVKRKIILEQGALIISLTKYSQIINNKRRIFTIQNEFLSYNKNQKIDKSIKKKAIKMYLNGASSSEVSFAFNKIFSPWTIFKIDKNILKNDDDLSQKNDFKEIAKDKKYLYIDMDDCWIRTKNNDRKVDMKRFRMITFHLGFDNEKNKKIIAKLTILESRFNHENNYKNTDEWVDFLRKIIEEYYGNHLKILVYGDGAKWIKKIALKLKAKYFLDKFHIIFNGFKVLGYSLKQYKNNYNFFHQYEQIVGFKFYPIFKKFINNFQINEAINFLKNLIKSNMNIPHSKVLEIIKLINYLKNNWLNNQFKNDILGYIGSHTEAWISHIVKHKTTRKFTSFSSKTINEIILSKQNENLKILLI